jgi:hypothetical protein
MRDHLSSGGQEAGGVAAVVLVDVGEYGEARGPLGFGPDDIHQGCVVLLTQEKASRRALTHLRKP